MNGVSKEGVVVVSRFGSEAGGTPGSYIRRYTSRLDATEVLTPYKADKSLQGIEQAYDERNDEADKVIEALKDEQELVKRDEALTDQSARVFGNRGLVYTKDAFDKAIQHTEQALQEGHTLISPVVSFSYDYLKENNVIDENLEEVKNDGDEGSYRGKVDQLKLRRSVTKGMDLMLDKAHFVEPEWTAAIQVDTANVHVHLTLIETCEAEKVPEERFVIRDKMEKVIEYDNDRIVKTYVPVIDDDGEIVQENLGERGKLSPSAVRYFREGMQQELTRMKSGKPFTNELSAHSSLVKQYAMNLSLEHTSLSSQLTQVYETLPKGKAENQTLTQQEKALIEAQSSWQASNDDESMEKPNQLVNDYVDKLLTDHSTTLGYEAFKAERDAYAYKFAPDSSDIDNTIERNQLKRVMDHHLKETLVDGIYNRLKDIRVVNDKEAYLRIFPDAEKYDGLDVMEGEMIPKGLQMALLDDESLKDKIADANAKVKADNQYVDLVSGTLTKEKRLRDFPKRYEAAKERHGYYTALESGFNRLDRNGQVSPDGRVMGDFYAVEKEYQKGVMDKYAYLMDKEEKPYLKAGQVRYPKPKDRDYEGWLDQVKDKVTKQAKENPNKKLLRGYSDSRKPLPEPIERHLKDKVNVPLSSALNNVKSLQEEDKIYQTLVSQHEGQLNRSKVTKERFNEVKSYDLIDTVYDFNANADRNVSPRVSKTYTAMQRQRNRHFDMAIGYLEKTNQQANAYEGYQFFKSEAEGAKESLAFAQTVENTLQLPRPLRRIPVSDTVNINERIMPPKKAKDLNIDMFDISMKIIEEEKEVIEEKRQSPAPKVSEVDIQAEMVRLNQYYLRKEELEDEEKEKAALQRQQDIMNKVPKAKPLNRTKALDEQFVQDLIRSQNIEMMNQRHIASYHQVSYDEPEM